MTGEQSIFESLAELIGKSGALNLCEQYGGQTLYIRKSSALPDALARHWSEYFGPDSYARLVERLGGQRVYIPMAPPELLIERDTDIFERRRAGGSAVEIARHFQLTPRSVNNIYCRVYRLRQDQVAKNQQAGEQA